VKFNYLRVRISRYRLQSFWIILLTKTKSILRESIIYHPRNVTMRRRILGLWNHSTWKMAPCIMEMLKQLPEIESQEFWNLFRGIQVFGKVYSCSITVLTSFLPVKISLGLILGGYMYPYTPRSLLATPLIQDKQILAYKQWKSRDRLHLQMIVRNVLKTTN